MALSLSWKWLTFGQYPLLFEFTEWEDRLELDLEYDTGVLSEQQVDSVQSLLMYILSNLALQPDSNLPVGQIGEGLKRLDI
ncbi:nonribosomal peptide synthase GliP2 [Penicillium waksmanii]|uniref:nonribosomal peptide synthase GliP2 n=1 Tax=Penicillium waksmanii TaxID=69791 RepID=UPI002547038A|nr:nonribosomal peptide synthase GliP2 [Penicillium waksmanii]KAJ5988402.1 nonribosomal peptide synthase GliP2 [Penicillium waksmanii]